MPTFIRLFISTSSTFGSRSISPENEKLLKSFKQDVLERIEQTMSPEKELVDILIND